MLSDECWEDAKAALLLIAFSAVATLFFYWTFLRAKGGG